MSMSSKPPSSARKPASPKTTSRKRSEPSVVLPDASDSTYDVLSKIGSTAHVRVTVNDLVAFEFVDDKTNMWRWGLGTVASIPGPRLVQLMLWEGGGGALPPEASPVSEAERAAAVRRLEELQGKRQVAEQEMEDLNKTLVVEQAHYNEGRAAYEADAQRAIADAVEAQKVVKELKESDWREIRSYVKPPDIVKLIMEATLITLGERTYDWNYILKVIRQRDFMKRLTEFDSLSISVAARRLLRKEYLSNPRFTHQDAMEGSRALGALQRWVSAQLMTSEATVDIVDFDKAHARDKKKLAKLEDTLRARRQEVEAYKSEETQLKTKLGDPPMHFDYAANGAAAASAPAAEKPPAKKTETKAKGGRAGAPPLHEDVHGGAHTWTFTEVSKVVLLSSILVNYDEPESTVITLTPEQLAQLKEALAARAAPFAEMQAADNKIKDLEDDLQDARGDLADALQDLADAKANQAEHNAQLAAKDREVEDAKEDAATAAAAAAAAAAKPEKNAALPPPKELAKQLADKDKEVADLKAALEEEKKKSKEPKDKKNGARGGPAEVVMEKEPMASGSARDGSIPQLFHAADDRELAKIIDRLEKEIRILRNESASANDVLEGVNATINGRAALKKFLSEDD